jgi:hypothetical protein
MAHCVWFFGKEPRIALSSVLLASANRGTDVAVMERKCKRVYKRQCTTPEAIWLLVWRSGSLTVSNLAGINLVVLLLGRCNRSQHQRMSHLDLRGVRKQMIVSGAEDRRLHRHGRVEATLLPAESGHSRPLRSN